MRTHGIRFAPSPTGRFHVGNLRTAWISHAWAKTLGEPWIIRVEDIDEPRVLPGAMEQQLSDLRSLGLEPDQVLVQSKLKDRHRALFEKAVLEGQVYPCFCSRKEVAEALQGMASAPHGKSAIYNGHCRALDAFPPTEHPTIGWRFRMPRTDGTEDFIVARTAPVSQPGELPAKSSFVPAYHWACAIDDHDGAYSLLVRAWDLSEAAEQQRAIQAWLPARHGKTPRFPAVFHSSVVTGPKGERLEKRTRGVTLDELLAAGWSAERIVDAFRRSCSIHREEFAEARVWGEARRTVSLSELGFSG